VKAASIKQRAHANIWDRDLKPSVPFYEMLGFEKFADWIFGDGAAVWPGLGVDGRRFRAAFMKIPGVFPLPFLDVLGHRHRGSKDRTLA